MSATKTEEWAERVGAEAVKEGIPCAEGLVLGGGGGGYRLEEGHRSWGDDWPDFRDRLTEKACELWVEDVAREVYGDDLLAITWEWSDDDDDHGHSVRIRRVGGGVRVCQGYPASPYGADTRAEAAICAVKAMRGAG